MATKTISIDLEAYDRLREARRENESFSRTIKRVVRRPFDLDGWLKKLDQLSLSPAAARAIERQIAARRERSRRAR